MNTAQVREQFLRFFETKQHPRINSSSLVPGNDPTLLFTNAGMVQFKDVFLGSDKRDYVRAASSQRCVRAGGKHNDLENVGYTARHHTFFEMLGNFSFGDYFKQDAIHYAWEFLTSDQWLNIPADKLTVTVYHSDDEAYAIWAEQVGVPVERIIRIGDKADGGSDNFWQMGDTGPCGPCSEIFYDHGADIWGGPPGSAEEDGDRFIEIWNIVFMQYERSADGKLTPLPNPSIDTGMGLERIAAVMQGVHSNYEIDLFQQLLAAVVKITGAADSSDKSLRVIADHIRSCGFLVVDGVVPSNEGRGYVLRRIIRRAVRHGNKLGAEVGFFSRLVPALVEQMGEAYPELREQQANVERILNTEEELFAKTLDNGMAILNDALAQLTDKVLPGELIFKLYDTYGFPTDLTNDIAREQGYELDMSGYEVCMQEQRQRSKNAGGFDLDYSAMIKLDGATEFTGYDSLHNEVEVVALFAQGNEVEQLSGGQQGQVVLAATPFYAESGGQVGDSGVLSADGLKFEVLDTTKAGESFLHHGQLVQGELHLGDKLKAEVNAGIRRATALNHTATHLLHAALREVVGEHVQQKGSLVDAEKLRFDISHFEPVSPEQLKQVEALVNAQIRANSAVETEIMDMDAAKAKGAMALFGEKYGDEVRVLSIGEGFSVELCGGTHASRTGDIGLIRITSESGVAAGVRRIEAVSGEVALAYCLENENTLDQVAAALKSSRDKLAGKVEQLLANNKKLEKELQQAQTKLAMSAGSDLSAQARDVAGIKVLATQLPALDRKALLSTMDQLKNQLGEAVVLLAAVDGDDISLCAGVTKALSKQYKAGDLMKQIAPALGGKGGGRPDMAQGGGNNVAALPEVLESVYSWVEAQA